MAPRLLLIDNYDSFTWNLVQAFEVLGAEVEVVRNDQISVAEAVGRAPTHLVISPGPGRPEQAGASLPIMEALIGRVPLLGVCLGHQCLGLLFGARVLAARRLRHGKESPVSHDGQTLFTDLPRPFAAGRYHSLVVAEAGLPGGLIISARSEDDDEIMGLRAPDLRAEGVQFHPESVLTPTGTLLLENFLRRV